MLFTILAWQIYTTTGNPLFIGFLGLSEVIPAIVFSLFAGNIIDSHHRKKIVVVVGICNVCIVTALTISSILFTENILVYIFLGFAFCVGTLRSFWGSTLSTIIPNVIPKEKIPQAGPYNTGSFLLGSIIGHALGGFMVAHLSLPIAFTFGIILFLLAFWNVCLLPFLPVEQKTKGNTFKNIMEGLQYVYQNKIIFSALVLDLFAVLFGGVVALLPVYAQDILFISPALFGWLNASMDIGAVMGIISMEMFPMKKEQGKKMIISVAGFGICIILFGLSKNYLFSLLILVVAGFLDSISMVVRGVILQSHVPNYIRGRVMSVNSIFVSSSNELGQFESGLTSRIMGVVPATIFGGCMTLIVVAGVAWFSPHLRNLTWKR